MTLLLPLTSTGRLTLPAVRAADLDERRAGVARLRRAVDHDGLRDRRKRAEHARRDRVHAGAREC